MFHQLPFERLVAIAALAVMLAAPAGARAETTPKGTTAIIDTHVHLTHGYPKMSMASAADQVQKLMDAFGVDVSIVLPMPMPPGHKGSYGRRELEDLSRARRARFAFAAGGDSLNIMIQETPPTEVSPDILRAFKNEAAAIVNSGAAGFGEFAALHLSSGRKNHPFESVPADHPLFLALADIAAEAGMPIDLHMEAVPQDMPTPVRVASRGPNPASLKENISGLERLLAHNRKARIVWAHAAWDNTGARTVQLMRSLLAKHSNLYMSIKLIEQAPPRMSPLDADGALQPRWRDLITAFPDRFVIGSDQFFDDASAGRLAQARRIVDALPPDLAPLVAHENARRIYRLARMP